jgi:hypothetical protein
VIAGLASTALTGGEPQLQGLQLAIRGIIHVLLGTGGIVLALRLAKSNLSDLGLVNQHLASDALIGTAVGILLPLLQFGLILPNTGGAARSDVAASRAIIGDSPGGLTGAVILGWTVGGFAEELFFRGHIFRTIRGWLGPNRFGLTVALLVSILSFGLLHAYQGIAGMMDTGFFAIVMSLLYLWRGRLAAPMIAHGLNDMLLLIGLYVLPF